MTRGPLPDSIDCSVGDDKFHDHCGIFGICRTGDEDAASYVYNGLFALQHRGQESAGIVVNRDGTLTAHKGMGLVGDIFSSQALTSEKGAMAIGHVRYSTTGTSSIENAQPFMANSRNGQIALAHNGNLVNTGALFEMLSDEGVVFVSESDTEVILNLIARNNRNGVVEAIKMVSQIIRGAYSLVLLLDGMLIGVRDSFGIRPLCIGANDDMVVLASESCALDAVGCALLRDVEPGEIVIVDRKGNITSDFLPNRTARRPCVFEHVYFARPDSIIDGFSVYESRRRAGALLAARDSGLEADIVIGVPDSGTSSAIGYASASGIPYGVGLIKNRYVGRTFIQPVQSMREESVKLKLNPLKETIEGKRVVLIDDSIVRGTTSKKIVDMLRNAGAREIHFRISSPPITFPCHLGIDTPTKKQLIAATSTEDEIRDMIGADTLKYLDMEELFYAMNSNRNYCTACFDGNYPIEVPYDS